MGESDWKPDIGPYDADYDNDRSRGASLRATIARDQWKEEEDLFAAGFYEATLQGPSRGERATMEPPSPEHDQRHANAPASPRGDWDKEDEIPYAARFFDPGAEEQVQGEWTDEGAPAEDHTGPYGYHAAGAAGRNKGEDETPRGLSTHSAGTLR